MPQVPQYNGNVQQNGIPTDRVPMQAPIEAFGGGEGMSGVAKQAQDLIQKGRDAADKVQILDAHSKATELKNKILHGYTDENGQEVFGALKQQGSNAMGLPESSQKEYEEGIQKITKDLNPRQINMFAPVSEEIRLSVDGKIREHVSGETYKMKIATMKSSIDINQKDAILNYTDEKSVEDAVNKITLSVNAGAKMAGLDADQTKQLLENSISDTHKKIIDRHLNNGNFAAADNYFKKNFNSLTGDDQSAVEKLVKSGGIEAKAFKMADDLTSDEAIKKGMTEKQAIKILRDEPDPAVRKIAEQRVEHFYTLQRKARDESQSDLNIRIAQELKKNGGDVTALPVRNLLRGASMETEKAAGSFAQYVKNGGKASDDTVYDGLEMRLKSSDPKIRYAVTKAEITDLELPLNETGERSRETLLKYYSKVQLNDEAHLKAIGDYISEDELVKQKIVDAGIDPKSEEAKVLNSRLKAEVRAIQQLQDGKPLHKEDKIKTIDRIMLQDSLGFFGKIINAGYGPGVAKLLNGNYRFTTKISDIDDDDLKKITDLLTEKKGVKPTDDQVLAVYNSRK